MEVDACVHNVAQDRIVKQIMTVIPWCSQDLAHRTLVTHKTLEASLSALVPSSETPMSAAGAAVDSGSSADAGGGSVDGMNTLLEMASEQSERDIARIVKERVCLQENAKILYPPLSAPAALGRGMAVDSGVGNSSRSSGGSGGSGGKGGMGEKTWRRWQAMALHPIPLPCSLAFQPPSHRDATTPSLCCPPHFMTQECIMFSNPTPSKPRLSPAATMSDDTPSALTLPLHCAPSCSLQPLLKLSLLSLGPSLLQFVSIVSPLLNH